MDASGNASTGRRGVSAAGAATVVMALLAAGGCQARDASAPSASWTSEARVAEAALAEKNVAAAARAVFDADVAARRSRQWEATLAVGKLQQAVGELAGTRFAQDARARDDYLLALMWAEAERSVDGILQAARAFATLGDRNVVDQCVRIAAQVARGRGDVDAEARVDAFRERWLAEVQAAEPGQRR